MALLNKGKNMTKNHSLDIAKIKDDIAGYGNKIFFNSAGSSLPAKSELIHCKSSINTLQFL